MAKTMIVGILGAVFMVAEVAFGGSAHIMKSRCSEDSLEPGQARERIEWAAKCDHITATEREYSLNDAGQQRGRPLYPLYGTENMSQIWRAPVDRNAPCKVEVLSEGYRIHYHVAKRHVLPAPWEAGFKGAVLGSALSSDGGSKIILTGGPSWDRTNNPQIRNRPRAIFALGKIKAVLSKN